jgi:hypothetical protein
MMCEALTQGLCRHLTPARDGVQIDCPESSEPGENSMLEYQLTYLCQGQPQGQLAIFADVAINEVLQH